MLSLSLPANGDRRQTTTHMEHYELTPEQLKQYIAVLDAAESYRDLSDDEKEQGVVQKQDDVLRGLNASRPT